MALTANEMPINLRLAQFFIISLNNKYHLTEQFYLIFQIINLSIFLKINTVQRKVPQVCFG